MSVRLSRAERHDLFPTTLYAYEHDAPALNAALIAAFDADPRWRAADQAEVADAANLAHEIEATPAFAELEALFLARLGDYARALGWSGEFDVGLHMFPNVAPAGHYVPSHNHVAHVAAVYYVRCPETDRPLVDAGSPMADYWRPEEGVLILHDPRFNASLMGAWQHYARVYPRPGVMVMFPAFLWHQVTPHFGAASRLAVAANFTLTDQGAPSLDKQVALRI